MQTPLTVEQKGLPPLHAVIVLLRELGRQVLAERAAETAKQTEGTQAEAGRSGAVQP
jgi:hypothetical protein